jgi:hypothetical protein
MIYILTDSRFYKIGYTKNRLTLAKRIKDLQSGNPNKLTLEVVVEGSLQQELAIHRKHRVFSIRHNPEWYRPEPAIKALIESVRRNGIDR